MDFTSDIISESLINIGWLLFAIILVAAMIKAPWRRMVEWDSTNVYFGMIVGLLMLWMMKVGVNPGQGFHLLGATALALMFGWPFAFFAISILVAITTAYNDGSWGAFAINTLMMGALPIAITYSLLRLCQRFLPHNFFIYIFINTFAAAALSIVILGFTAAGLLIHSDIYTAEELSRNYLPYLWLIALPEAVINGIIMTGAVVYKPSWVATFNDATYLKQ